MTGTRRLLAALLLALLAGAAALVVLPARWVMAWIPAQAPVIVTNATGTFWAAEAMIAVGAPGLRRSLPDPVHWRFSLAGGPHLAVEHPWLRGVLKLSPTWRGLKIGEQVFQLPATALTTLHALLNTLDPEGEVQIRWSDLVLDRGGIMPGNPPPLVQIEWHNASSSLSRIRPLGDFTLGIRPQPDRTLALVLESRAGSGPLRMQGTGRMSATGQVRFDGQAWADDTASASTRAALGALLEAMGPPSTEAGKVSLSIR